MAKSETQGVQLSKACLGKVRTIANEKGVSISMIVEVFLNKAIADAEAKRGHPYPVAETRVPKSQAPVSFDQLTS